MISPRTAKNFNDPCQTSHFEGGSSPESVRRSPCSPPSRSAEFSGGSPHRSIPTWDIHRFNNPQTAPYYILVPKFCMADSNRRRSDESGQTGSSRSVASASCGRLSYDNAAAGPWKIHDERLLNTRSILECGSGMDPSAASRDSGVCPTVSGVSHCGTTTTPCLETREGPLPSMSSNIAQDGKPSHSFQSAAALAEQHRKVKVAKFIEKKLRARTSAPAQPMRYPARSVLAAHRSRQGGRFAKENSRVLTK